MLSPPHPRTPIVLFLPPALAACLTFLSCARGEPDAIDPGPPPVTSLQLVGAHSLSVTEPSGLAWSAARRALLMVSDNSPAVYTIDSTGGILGSVPVDGQDLEGIALSRNEDTMYVVEESLSRVTTFLRNGTKLSTFPVTVRTEPSHSLEGITVDDQGHLVVINEQAPMMMLTFAGQTELSRTVLGYTTDISDICYDAQGNCFWIVSDESQKVIRISKAGVLLGEWTIAVRQGEGIAVAGNRLYIVSDVEAKLYVFVRPA